MKSPIELYDKVMQMHRRFKMLQDELLATPAPNLRRRMEIFDSLDEINGWYDAFDYLGLK